MSYADRRKACRGEAAKFFAEIVLPHDGDECLTWPFAVTRKGYAVMQYHRRLRSVHRVACELVHGYAPSEVHEAAHSCGRGHLGCVNPNHIRWATRLENSADRTAHGRTAKGQKNGAAKLTDKQALEIAALLSKPDRESYSTIAKRYDVSIYPIYSIAKRLNWGATVAGG